MHANRAVVVDPGAPGRLTIAEVPEPRPVADEALVQVAAVSLNRGEVQLATTDAPAGWRPGRDLAGVILREAADGTGPRAGARVVGMRDEPGVWAERIAVPTGSLAELPPSVSFAQAAALPVAALTALYALRKGGLLLGKRVLITGSTGGVGLFAHQLARSSGAEVVGMVRRDSDIARVRAAGADAVVVGDVRGMRRFGPYDLIVESLGGTSFAAAVESLAPDGVLVNIGWSAERHAQVDVQAFNRIGGAQLYGLRLDTELRGRSKTADLATLAGLVADGKLDPQVEIERDWEQIAFVAEDLLQRRFAGKAVLRVHTP